MLGFKLAVLQAPMFDRPAPYVAFQDLAPMIHRAPQIVHLLIDLHIHFIDMPAPIPEPAHLPYPLAADIGGEQRTKSIPSQPHGLMA